MTRPVDLHTHSTKSDGSYTPTELIDYAVEKGLAAIALTDHDTTDGLDEAIGHAAALTAQNKPSVEVIPGIELSTEYNKKDIHMVGLFVSYQSPAFQKKLQSFVDSRILRNQKMCANLREAAIDISYEKLLDAFPGSVITRGHYATYLMEHGYVKSRKDAFSQYLGDHTKYFVPREKVSTSEAVHLILDAGGVPILAHPTLYHMGSDALDQLVHLLKDAGLIGIEAIYSTYTNQEQRDIMRLASKYDLLPSGGSDFHGSNKPGLDLAVGYGGLFVPDEILENIRMAAKSVAIRSEEGFL